MRRWKNSFWFLSWRLDSTQPDSTFFRERIFLNGCWVEKVTSLFSVSRENLIVKRNEFKFDGLWKLDRKSHEFIFCVHSIWKIVEDFNASRRFDNRRQFLQPDFSPNNVFFKFSGLWKLHRSTTVYFFYNRYFSKSRTHFWRRNFFITRKSLTVYFWKFNEDRTH